ncbi:Fc receptor-like protein 5 isoform X3 [Micropterus salmoides]|uniref:Fc receptor-like protein 5 isoform X3 n=1 Tax=Micropterus salmoides TaxID=27706 RepID=UPI0018ED2AB3|nr:Fc receptor-like protein 5 isoform X3 [Micropterus salmoides]
MGHTFLCVLECFLLNILLHCGHSQDSLLTIEPNWSTLFTGESVTFICDMGEGKDTDWYYRMNKDGREFLHNNTNKNYTLQPLDTGHSGEYQCFGSPKVSTHFIKRSNNVSLTVSARRPKAELSKKKTVSPAGGSVTLSCSVNPSSGWKYFWYRGEKTSEPLNTQDAVFISNGQISVSQGGLYWCRGGRGDPVYYTEHSNAIVTNRAVVTLQPNWSEIYSGETISLRCEIKDGGDTEWEYEWKTSSSYKPQKQHEYIIGNASSHNGEYSCRGKPKSEKSSTEWSDAFTLKLSDNFHPAASLTVSPDRVQHFTEESVSLSCEGNSTKWRVRRFSKFGHLTHCSSWGTMTGSTCNTNKSQYTDGVYWCESETGQFSNAVNITGQNSDLILVSPVHPVAEGDSVTLGCKLKTENVLSNVNFYKNDKLIQSDTRGELTIPAVSKSDEGFYKCEGKYSPHQGSRSSPKSWISVKSASRSAFPVLLIVGLVVGILLIVPLALLLCLYKQSKDTCFHRLIQSQRTNQSSATVHTVNQYESLQQVYSTLHHGDVCVYETISGSGNTGSGEGVDEYINVSSEIQLEGLGNMSISDDPVESSDFYNANPDSTEGP